MIKIVNYLNEIEKDYKKGCYTPLEYEALRNSIEEAILKNNLNKF